MKASSQSSPGFTRLGYLDWLRGVAAVTMLQGHVFNSFLKSDLRNGGPYQLSQFAGGMPPAIFLFLLGVTFAFLMDSRERKGFTAGRRFIAAVKRSGYLFAAAFLFRLQLWIFSFDQNSWTDIFRVDILNNMGLALLVLAIMAVFKTVERVRLCAILGVAIAAASPVISGMDWQWTPEFIRNYIVPDHNFFGFFPWAAFVAFGMSAGSLIRRLKPEDVPATMQWMGWGGISLAFAAYTISNMSASIYPNSDFWLNSPALVFIKLGVVLILMAFAYVWNMQLTAGEPWSWVRQFGVTSLLVYWVHVELVYGRWLGYWKQNMSVGECAFTAVIVILLMLGLSLLKTNWNVVTAWLGAAGDSPRRVSGD